MAVVSIVIYFHHVLQKSMNNSTVWDTQVLAACAQGSEGTNLYIL